MKTNRQIANQTWKEANFSLSGIINYCVKNYSHDKELRSELSGFTNEAKASTKQADLKAIFTYDKVKEAIGDYQFKKQLVTKEDGTRSFQPTTEPRTKFSLYSFLQAINKK